MKPIVLASPNIEEIPTPIESIPNYPPIMGAIMLIVALTAYSKVQMNLINKLVKTLLKYNKVE